MPNYLRHFRALITAILGMLTLTVYGQCPTTNFVLDATACRNEIVEVSNLSTNATEYYWDFCSDDMQATPSAIQLTSSSSILSPYGYKTVFDNGKWYGFIADRAARKIFRVDYGTDLENPDPTYVQLTGSGSFFNSPTVPEDIDLLKVGANWFAVVTRDGFGTVVALDFGSNIENTEPTHTELGNFGIGSKTRGVDLSYDIPNARIIMALTASNASLTLVDLGNSLFNPGTTSFIPVTGASPIISAVSLLQTCDNWFLFAGTYGVNKIHLVSFGTDVMAVPTSTVTHTVGSNTEPWRMNAIREGDKTYLLVSDLSTGYSLIDFGRIELGDSPSVVSSANPLNKRFTGADVVSYRGKYLFHGLNLSDAQLNRITFSSNCGSSLDFSTLQSPPTTRYANSGTHKVLLRSSNAGRTSEIFQTISISSLDAPDVSIGSTNICVNNDVFFSPVNTSGNITTYDWDFGDGIGSSLSPNPVYTYTGAGEYVVSLIVQASNGCENSTQKNIEIYPAPVSDFTLPSGLICTNNEFTFSNNTVDEFDGNLIYQWLIDEAPVSNDVDLVYTFESGGDKEIKLQASIPGCTSEATQVLSNVGDGPVVDFSIDGNCLNESIQFNNNSTGDIDSYAWNFGNGEISNETSPSLQYTDAGMFDVELQTLGVNGCTSTKLITHQIYSLPQPSFNIDLPPFSCNGSPTQFNDLTPPLTDSNLDTWQWNFGDGTPGSNAPSPQHNYDLSGIYSVMLTVVSDQGCSTQVTQNVTISEALNPVITNSPACINVGVELSETSGVAASAWQWQIGNTFYFTENPSHVFGQPGDYSISLMLTGENGCIGTSLKEINVPDPLSVDFESTKKCVGTESQFTALSSGSSDLPSTYLWKFSGEERAGAISNYTFTSEGLKEVQLTVITESGCSYSINKAVTILPTPQADFSFTPIGGAPPLSVQFTNLSTNTSAYLWSFNDTGNTTSTVTSPSFVFTEIGNYPVDLLATNEEGCESTRTRLVSVALPLLNVSLENVELLENPDGSIRVLSRLQNNGNISVQNLVLEIELSNGTRLRETLQESLLGGEQITYQLSTIIGSATDLQFLCLKIVLANNASEAIQERCVALHTSTALTPPYPNPATDLLVLEWVSAVEETVTVAIINLSGKEVLAESFNAQQGLNTRRLNTQDWQSGLYLVKFKSATADRTFRTIIAR